jgi:hypothetical protein
MLPRVRSLRRLLVVLVVFAAGALGTARAAEAVNYVPNPGFEACTAGQPMFWSAFGAATIQCDATNPHSGSSSLAVSGAGGAAGAESACIVVPPSTSITDFSMWYRTSTPTVVQAAFTVLPYTSTNCAAGTQSGVASAGAGFSFITPIVTDGAWHQVAFTHVLGADINSVKFQLNFQCNTVCAATVNFDDLAYANATLAATLRSFTAAATRSGVRLSWRTASERDVLGFNVYRVRSGARVRVNRRLIGARGSAAGARYSLVDRLAPRGASSYRLQLVNRDGSRSWVGAARVALTR